MDNRKIKLDAGAFWVQLNYQLIHTMDFLPVIHWQSMDCSSAPAVQQFIALYTLLAKAQKLEARIHFDISGLSSHGIHDERMCRGSTELATSRREGLRKQMMKFSREIGHSLDFRLKWSRQPCVSKLC